MNCPHVVWALRQRGLSASERLVLIYLADKANGSLVCWPAMATIAKALELSPRTVHSAVHKLVKISLIRIEAKARTVHHYHILRPIDAAKSADEPSANAAEIAAIVMQELPKDVQNLQLPMAQTVANLADEPAIKAANFAEESPKEESPKKEDRLVDHRRTVVAAWNEMAKRTGLSAVRSPLAQDRVRSLNARLGEHGLDGMLQAITEIEASKFCRGEVSDWAASFDFLTQAKSCRKAIEGNYRDRKSAETKPAPERSHNPCGLATYL